MDVKVEKVDKIPECDLLSEIHKMIAGRISDNYDNLVFSLLEPFGITKDNARENVDRVVIFQSGWTKHFHIDGEYRFSIMEEPGELIFDDDGGCSMRINYKVEVSEELLFGGKNI